MSDLATTYLGIELRNPIIVGASHLTGTLRKIRACEKAGAGAVVIRTISEQVVRSESRSMLAKMKSPSNSDVRATLDELGHNLVLDDYLELVEEAKKRADIPIIASIYCYTARGWEEYASRIEAVGADAIQLNLFDLGAAIDRSGVQIEKSFIDVVKRVHRRVQIPLVVKLGRYLSSPANLIEGLSNAGARGIVLFNRFYGPDVDTERLKLVDAPILSSESEALPALRWIGVLSGQINVELAASGGIHTAQGIIKQLLVGAQAVEVSSALYINGLDHIGRMTSEIEGWMKRHKFTTLSDFRGSLCQDRSKRSRLFETTRYSELASGKGAKVKQSAPESVRSRSRG